MTGHDGTVEDICALTVPGGRSLLASAGADGTVRLWDPATGQPAAPPLTGHACPVFAVARRPAACGPASCPGHRRERWDGAAVGPGHRPARRPASDRPRGHRLRRGVVPGHRLGKLPALATAGADGTVRLWDLATGQPAAPPLTGHVGNVLDVCTVPGRQPGHPPALATTGYDGTVRLWDPVTGQPARPAPDRPRRPRLRRVRGARPPAPCPGHHRGRRDGAAVGPGHRPARRPAPDRPHRPHPRRCAVPGRQPGQLPALATAGEDGTVRRRIRPPASPPPRPSPATPAPSRPCARCPAAHPGGPPPWSPPGETGRCGCGIRPLASPPPRP